MNTLLRVSLICLLMLLTQLTAAQDDDTTEDNVVIPQDAFFYTYHHASGNKFIDGTGTFPNVRQIDMPLAGVPAWVVGYAANTVALHVVLQNGDLQLIEVSMDGVGRSLGVQPNWYSTGQPFVVGASMVEGGYVLRGDNTVSPLSHPIPIGDVDLLYIATNGDLVLARETGELARLPLNAMRDARPVVSDSGKIAVYVDPTDQRYVHGIMGDNLEAAALAVVELSGSQLRLVSRIELPDTDVFEGLFPIWADVDEDDTDELIVTVSNGRMGAQIRAYKAEGTLLASGPAIGQGNRWRHPLAWGAFGPNGEKELVDVLTPHISGIVEFYRLEGDALNIIVNAPGYTSHVIGSRNLDMGVAGDFNGDGQLEMAVVNQARTHIVGIQHMADDAREVWSLELGGRLISNLAAVTLPNGTLGLAAGTDDGRLRVWLPE